VNLDSDSDMENRSDGEQKCDAHMLYVPLLVRMHVHVSTQIHTYIHTCHRHKYIHTYMHITDIEDDEQQREITEALEKLRTNENFAVLEARRAEVERLQQLLEQRKEILENSACLTFSVKDALVGLMIGKKGSNKAKAEAVEGVMSVKIVDGSCTILARNEEAAELARDVLEFMQVCAYVHV
jgi:hypothetical protein